MSFDKKALAELLPAILSVRDRASAVSTPAMLHPRERSMLARLDALDKLSGELQSERDALRTASMAGPLTSLLALLAEQLAILEEDIAQLYDDQFVETCADWVVPYIGNLVGYRVLSGRESRVASPRAEVARTLRYRRRKGTAAVLEQIAADVTGWNAKATEFFNHIIVSQHINHPRPHNFASPDVRRWQALEYSKSAFDPTARSLDVRSIARGLGRHNIRNVGIFLWRVSAYPLSRASAARLDPLRWRFHPLGLDQPVFNSTQGRDETQTATPSTVPVPLNRRALAERLAEHYGTETDPRSLRLYVGTRQSLRLVPVSAIRIANLSDAGNTWAYAPEAGRFAIDPELGRIALPAGLPAETIVEADFHYGAVGELGGGEYERTAAATSLDSSARIVRVPDDFLSIATALRGINTSTVIEITDSRSYAEALTINLPPNVSIELRAANRCRPTLVLSSPLVVVGRDNTSMHLDGLLIAGSIDLPAANNQLRRLDVRHCTLVPGQTLLPNGTPGQPSAASLTSALPNIDIVIDRSIVGALRTHERSNISVSNSIVDATDATRAAFAGTDGVGAGGALTLSACTIVGKLRCREMALVTNSLVLARLAPNDPWAAPVIAERRQTGCVRFSYVPANARVPRRFGCLPESAPTPERAAQRFTSLRYGTPAYGQLSAAAGDCLLVGADDGGQPGALHFLNQPQREANLRTRLNEYLRVGLEAGIFYES